ncbi:hypothetical protein QEN19_001498 [Hanseniaspora menglaensis]
MFSAANSHNLSKNHPILNVKPSYNSLIRGCPGIPNTLPRVEFELHILAPNTLEKSIFIIDHLEVSFKTIEQLFLNSSNGKEDAVTGQKNIKVQTFKKRLKMRDASLPPLLGLKMPITIGIPETVKQTNVNNKFGKTYSTVEVVCHYKTKITNKGENGLTKKLIHIVQGNEESDKNIESRCAIEFPIFIDKYNEYPSTRKYPSLTFTDTSPDKRINIEYKLNTTCFGQDDMISVDLKLSKNEKANSGYYNGNGDLLDEAPINAGPSIFIGGKKKLKLKEITLELKEVLEVLETQDGSMKTKENVLCSTTNVINELITSNDITTKLDLRLMLQSQFHKIFEDAVMSSELLFKHPDEIEHQNEEQTNKYINNYFKDNKLLKPSVPEVSVISTTTKVNENNHQDSLNTYGSLTTRGCYFNITHYVTLKFKCSGLLKSFDITQPVKISHWNIPQIKYLEKQIIDEMETAKNAKQFYDNFGGIKKIYTKDENDNKTGFYLDYPFLPPMVIPYDLNYLKSQFGIDHELKNGELKMTPLIF